MSGPQEQLVIKKNRYTVKLIELQKFELEFLNILMNLSFDLSHKSEQSLM